MGCGNPSCYRRLHSDSFYHSVLHFWETSLALALYFEKRNKVAQRFPEKWKIRWKQKVVARRLDRCDTTFYEMMKNTAKDLCVGSYGSRDRRGAIVRILRNFYQRAKVFVIEELQWHREVSAMRDLMWASEESHAIIASASNKFHMEMYGPTNCELRVRRIRQIQ